MLWPWSKKVIEYVPIPAYGLYKKLCENEGYLHEVAATGDNRVWLIEITETVRILREFADNAQTPEALKSYNECIKEVKKLLILHKVAKQQIDNIKVRKEMKA